MMKCKKYVIVKCKMDVYILVWYWVIEGCSVKPQVEYLLLLASWETSVVFLIKIDDDVKIMKY